MQLHEILHKSKGKVSDKGQTFRKAEIATDDRPYKEKKFDKIGRQKGDKRETILDTTVCVSMGDKQETMPRIGDADHSKKVGENVSQSYNDVNGRQTGDKQEINSIEISEEIKKPNITKIYNDDNIVIGLFLHGNEKRLYDFLYDSRQPGSNITFALTKQKIIESVLIPDSCLKKTLSRIINKGFLKVYSSQSGRFGWRMFELN